MVLLFIPARPLTLTPPTPPHPTHCIHHPTTRHNIENTHLARRRRSGRTCNPFPWLKKRRMRLVPVQLSASAKGDAADQLD